MKTNMWIPEQVQSWGLTILRVVVGLTAFMHGWRKLTDGGIDQTSDSFAALGIPLPDAMATLVIAVEVIGGIALILGLATPIIALLLAGIMAGAYITVHSGSGFFAADGGYELLLLIAAGAITVLLAGPGAVAVENHMPALRQRSRDRTRRHRLQSSRFV